MRVADLLEARGLTQKRLAELVGKPQPTISRLLSGHRGIRVNDLDAVAQVLLVPVAELLRAPDDPIYELNPREGDLIRRFRALSPAGQDALLTLLPQAAKGAPHAVASSSSVRFGARPEVPPEVEPLIQAATAALVSALRVAGRHAPATRVEEALRPAGD